MPAILPDNSTIAKHIRCRGPRKPTSEPSPNLPQTPTPHLTTLSQHIQSTRCKSTFSSLLFSTFNNTTTTTTDTTPTTPKKKNFASGTLRGLGCAASAQVSVPAAIRSSANWESEKVMAKKKTKKQVKKKNEAPNQGLEMENEPEPLLESVSEADVSVDCVVSRRTISERAKFEVNQSQRERPSGSSRRMVNPEPATFMDSDHSFVMTRSGLDVFGARYHRHVRHPSPDSLEEIIMLRSSLLMGGRSDGFDRYRNWRLDVDNMSYEELLELGDRIGYANTGLKEDDIVHCLRKAKLSDALSSQFPPEMELKCSICQEDYEEDDEMGKLECGHFYHIHCIRQWLVQKNICPICKKAAASQL